MDWAFKIKPQWHSQSQKPQSEVWPHYLSLTKQRENWNQGENSLQQLPSPEELQQEEQEGELRLQHRHREMWAHLMEERTKMTPLPSLTLTLPSGNSAVEPAPSCGVLTLTVMRTTQYMSSLLPRTNTTFPVQINIKNSTSHSKISILKQNYSHIKKFQFNKNLFPLQTITININNKEMTLLQYY